MLAASLTHHGARSAGALLGAHAVGPADPASSRRCRSRGVGAVIARALRSRRRASRIAVGLLGYPLVHGNPSSRRREAAAGRRRALGEQVVPRARGDSPHAQGARASSRGAAAAIRRSRRSTTVSFAVERGEFFGIAGRNGSGKSTLLKCLAGIYQREGDIWCRGRLSTLIELGVGFNMDMAARDNVVMNGIMLGLSPREARKRYESVIEFAELQEFKDLKLKNYSSGMQVRLAFSVAIQVDADILMIDEVLAVGDAAFQQKCFDVFNDLRDRGRTIVFVTHDMGAHAAILSPSAAARARDPVYLGEPHEVADRYLELNFGRDPAVDGSQRRTSASGDGRGADRRGVDRERDRRAALRTSPNTIA